MKSIPELVQLILGMLVTGNTKKFKNTKIYVIRPNEITMDESNSIVQINELKIRKQKKKMLIRTHWDFKHSKYPIELNKSINVY